MPIADSSACHLNLYRNTNFSALNTVVRLLNKAGCKFLIADQQAHALPKTAKIARGQPQPAA